ncbi:RNA polymerase sigma-70 factor (ECF subfamily) [Streptacidiphilus sp. MAP12-16]|uniref:RNA polymerase sigma factor SigI n=1 Tax=Streptacidiphilus sp. MAP12-16 TaxID=3156300 RepID=UPI0035176602
MPATLQAPAPTSLGLPLSWVVGQRWPILSLSRRPSRPVSSGDPLAPRNEEGIATMAVPETRPNAEDRFTQAWHANRGYLIDLAFRILRDIGESEDAVQEAFSRLAETSPAAIDDERGWLTVVTSRLCLDRIRSARSRHERVDGDVVETARRQDGARPVDPADRITLDDEVRLALLLVLQRLSPAERVAFILHDVFQTPFADIAEVLGSPAPTCRQLARRARQKIGAVPPRTASAAVFDSVASAEHRLVTERFITACGNGDIEALLVVLHPQVWGVADFGTDSPIPRQDNHGAGLVAELLVRHYAHRITLVTHPLGGEATMLAFAGRELFAVMVLTVENGLITKIDVAGDPGTVAVAGRALF